MAQRERVIFLRVHDAHDVLIIRSIYHPDRIKSRGVSGRLASWRRVGAAQPLFRTEAVVAWSLGVCVLVSRFFAAPSYLRRCRQSPRPSPARRRRAPGHIPLAVPDIPASRQLINDGRLRALGVSAAKRVGFLPDVPTLAEQGLDGFESVGWFGIVAPAGTPSDVIETLNAGRAKSNWAAAIAI